MVPTDNKRTPIFSIGGPDKCNIRDLSTDVFSALLMGFIQGRLLLTDNSNAKMIALLKNVGIYFFVVRFCSAKFVYQRV